MPILPTAGAISELLNITFIQKYSTGGVKFYARLTHGYKALILDIYIFKTFNLFLKVLVKNTVTSN